MSVTADHSHTMTMGGYPGRLADIRGVAQVTTILQTTAFYSLFYIRPLLMYAKVGKLWLHGLNCSGWWETYTASSDWSKLLTGWWWLGDERPIRLVLISLNCWGWWWLGDERPRQLVLIGLNCSQGDDGWVMRGLDGQPFPILGYANGPGFKRLRWVLLTTQSVMNFVL